MTDSSWSRGLVLALQVLLVLVAIVVVIAMRQPDKVWRPQFWAEDGSIFYLQAEYSGLASLWRPYSGYWHAYPRLVAVVGTRVPVLYLPWLYATGALLATTGALVMAIRADLVHHWSTRAALVLAVLLAPPTDELWLILTNSQWFGALFLVALVAAPAPSGLGRIMRGVAGAIMALSGPFAILLWPCAALRAWWHRDRWSAWLLVGFTVCAALSLIALLQDPRSDGVAHLSERWMPLWRTMRGNKLDAIAAAGGLLFLALGLARGLSRRDWPLVACTSAALSIAAATLVTIPGGHLAPRYWFLPWTLCAWTAVMLAGRSVRAAWLVVAAVLAVSLTRFSLPGLESHDWPRDARCLETHRDCDILINPGWAVGLPGRGTLPRARTY